MSDTQGPRPAGAEHGHPVLSGREATQAIKLGHMRYVLGIGLGLSVGAGVILAFFF